MRSPRSRREAIDAKLTRAGETTIAPQTALQATKEVRLAMRYLPEILILALEYGPQCGRRALYSWVVFRLFELSSFVLVDVRVMMLAGLKTCKFTRD